MAQNSRYDILWICALTCATMGMVTLLGMLLNIQKLVGLRPVHELPNMPHGTARWWASADEFAYCHDDSPSTPFLPIGTPKAVISNHCPLPGPHRIYKGYGVANHNIQGRTMNPNVPGLTKVFTAYRKKMQWKVTNKDPQRLEVFASETSFAGFLNSIFVLPYRVLLGKRARSASTKHYRVTAHYSTSPKGSKQSSDEAPKECPRYLLPELPRDPLIQAVLSDAASEDWSFTNSLESVPKVDVSLEDSNVKIAEFLSSDLANFSNPGMDTCLEYYLKDQFTGMIRQTKTDQTGKEFHAVKNSSSLSYETGHGDEGFPPSPYLESVFDICSFRSNIKHYVWNEEFALLGVQDHGTNDPALRKFFERWWLYGDLFSPCYYQSSLVIAITSTIYWYIIPMTIWCVTAFCSTAPISLVHVPRMVIYWIMAAWRNYGLYYGFAKVEKSIFPFEDFDFSDHVVLYMMQVLILVLELAAISRSVAVIRGHSSPSHNTQFRIMWHSFENTILGRANEAIGGSSQARVLTFRQLLETYPRQWIGMVVFGSVFDKLHPSVLLGEGYSSTTLHFMIFGPCFYLLGAVTWLATNMFWRGLMPFIRDLLGSHHQLNRAPLESNEADKMSLRLLYGAALACTLFIGITIYASFYTALFFHTKMETLVGYLVGAFGLYFPIILVLVFFIRPESLGLIDQKRESKID